MASVDGQLTFPTSGGGEHGAYGKQGEEASVLLLADCVLLAAQVEGAEGAHSLRAGCCASARPASGWLRNPLCGPGGGAAEVVEVSSSEASLSVVAPPRRDRAVSLGHAGSK